MTAAFDIFHRIWLAGVEHFAILVIGYDCGGDFAAVFTNGLERIPIFSAIGFTNFFIGFANQMSILQK